MKIRQNNPMIDSNRSIEFELLENQNTAKTLLQLKFRDGSSAEISPPVGYEFSYLSRHPALGISVVASKIEKREKGSILDWHFGYDEKSGTLFKHCRAY